MIKYPVLSLATSFLISAALQSGFAQDKSATQSSRGPVVLTEKALEIHRKALLIDGHNDLPWEIRDNGQGSLDRVDIAKPQPKIHTDIPRLRKGGVGAQFWSAWVPSETAKTRTAVQTTLQQIDLIHQMVKRYPETFEWASKADDIERIHKAGKIACMIGVEGGHSIDNSFSTLRNYYDLGVRYMTLTHSDNVDWADSATDKPQCNGLSPFGKQIVGEMNRIGMLVDISHVSAKTMHDVLDVAKAPVIASHSSAFAIAEHPRNVPDDVLKRVKENGGVIMVNFYSGFILPDAIRATKKMAEQFRELRAKYPNREERRVVIEQWRKANPVPRGTIHTLIDHIEHIIKIAGIDHVGLGSDYDGIPTLPEQLDDVSTYPYITQELLNRGHSEEDIIKILGGNVLRAMRRAEAVAKDLQSRHTPIPMDRSNNVASITGGESLGDVVSLFSGKDFSNWVVPSGDNGHWKIVDGVIDYDALSESKSDKNLWSEKEYTDFVLKLEWRIKETPFINKGVPIVLPDGSAKLGPDNKPITIAVPDSDSGVYVRGSSKSQINIWCWPIGSGEVYGYRTDSKMPPEVRAGVTPKVNADKNVGEWNSFVIKMKGSKLTVVLNGVTVIENADLPDVPAKGKIALQHHGSKDKNGNWTGPPSIVQFRNISIQELGK